jgi:hypothetical protein
MYVYLPICGLFNVSISIPDQIRMVGKLTIDISAEKPVITNCEVISQKLPGETEKCHEKRQSA